MTSEWQVWQYILVSVAVATSFVGMILNEAVLVVWIFWFLVFATLNGMGLWY